MIQNSNKNKIINYKGIENEVGILLNSAEGTEIKGFFIKDKNKYRGVVLVRASDTQIKNGKIESCKKGLVLNLSPVKRGTKNYIEDIKLVKNVIGIYLHTTAEQRNRNIFKNVEYVSNKTNLMDEWKTHK